MLSRTSQGAAGLTGCPTGPRSGERSTRALCICSVTPTRRRAPEVGTARASRYLVTASQRQVKCSLAQPEASQQTATERENPSSELPTGENAYVAFTAGEAACRTLGSGSTTTVQAFTPAEAAAVASGQAEAQPTAASPAAATAAVTAAEAPVETRSQLQRPPAPNDLDEEACESEEEISVQHGVSDRAAGILNPVMVDLLNNDKLTGLLVEILGQHDELRSADSSKDTATEVGGCQTPQCISGSAQSGIQQVQHCSDCKLAD